MSLWQGMAAGACRTGALISLSVLALSSVNAAEVRVAWDASPSAEASGYWLYVGERSGDYGSRIDVGKVTAYTVTGLDDGKTYFFNLSSYAAQTSNFSDMVGEISKTVPLPPAPQADFRADVVTGQAPLTVSLSDHSSGDITAWSWDFGNGGRSSGRQAIVNYTEPGSYRVALTVTGPGGSDTETRAEYINVSAAVLDNVVTDNSGDSDVLDNTDNGNSGNSGGTDGFAVETGELAIDEKWQLVSFEGEFIDPVVVAGPMQDDAALGVVRLRNIGVDGFEIRAEAWDYLGAVGIDTTVSYVVVERGHHILADGTAVEAGWYGASGRRQFSGEFAFQQRFAVTPVLVTSLASDNEDDTATPRAARVSASGFLLHLQEQESNRRSHQPETVAYIAWEPSTGSVGGLDFEVRSTSNTVRHEFFGLRYDQSFASAPTLLANMQTINGGDAATLRSERPGLLSIRVRVAEEQSLDSETRHNREKVGYMLFAPAR